MRTTFRTEAEAHSVSRRKLLSGWHDARITEAIEKPSKRGNDMIELTIMVPDGDGNERTFRDYLTDTALGAVKLRHACEGVGALERFEAGEIAPEDFVNPGAVRVKLGVEKKRGYPDRNVIEDYAASSAAPVVPLRSAQ
jgi:hypothetical protein